MPKTRPPSRASSPGPSVIVRPIDAASSDEIELVATRMRLTLIEVLGEARGATMYTLDWLRDRVRFHLDPSRSAGAVFVADIDRAIVGHTIVRVDADDAGAPIGLFSTTSVDPGARGRGVASALLDEGERWMRARSLSVFYTYTSTTNVKLIRLFEKRGYAIVDVRGEMLRLAQRP